LNSLASIFGCDVYTVQQPGEQFFPWKQSPSTI
jgi:hypothetical protein